MSDRPAHASRTGSLWRVSLRSHMHIGVAATRPCDFVARAPGTACQAAPRSPPRPAVTQVAVRETRSLLERINTQHEQCKTASYPGGCEPNAEPMYEAPRAASGNRGRDHPVAAHGWASEIRMFE